MGLVVRIRVLTDILEEVDHQFVDRLSYFDVLLTVRALCKPSHMLYLLVATR